MQRRAFVTLLGGAAAWPLGASAQQTAKTPRIGFLASDLVVNHHLPRAFRQGLHDLGYEEGRNVVIEFRDAEGKLERLPTLAAELVALKVDVIVAGNVPQAMAAMEATRTLPIVFAAAADPVASGLVTSLARPGGNVTGLSLMFPELVAKWLELLKQVNPEASRIALLWQPGVVGERTEKDILMKAEAAARALGMRLQVVEVGSPADFNRAFSDMTKARTDALAVMSTPTLFGERRRLLDLAANNRLPTVFPYREYLVAGGLIAYGPNIADLYRRIATYVDKILKGAKPADLPVEQPTKFDLIINIATARALGLQVPDKLLALADEVIE